MDRKKHYAGRLTAAALCVFTALLLGACSVDVNSLAGTKESSAESSSRSSDTDKHSDKFYSNDTDSESDTAAETDTASDTESDAQAFDESKYLPMFISGGAQISLTADALYGSEEIGSLKCGERVSVVQKNVPEYTFVYSAALEKFGYVRSEYLADYLEETTVGEVMYTKPAQTDIYKDIQLTQPLETVMQNEMITVIVKRADGKWRVADKNGNIGYIDKSLLSDKKIKTESSSKQSDKNKSSSSSKAQSKSESKAESKADSKTESKVESKTESAASSAVSSKAESSSQASSEETASGEYTGEGDAPIDYTTYIVDVDVGYLSLRDAPNAEKSKTIGELYYEERVYVIDSSGDFWYVYVPSLGMYGYVTGDASYLYPEYYAD